MPRSRKSNRIAVFLLQFAVLMCALSSAAKAELLHGKFLDGKVYNGEYAVAESSNEDGMRVNPVTIKLKIDEEGGLLTYKYVADDIPSVTASNLGILLIVVNSGGMEGSVTYNYVLPKRGALVSIGTVQTSLHRGKVENIDARPNGSLTKSEVNALIRQIVEYNPSALSDPLNAYPAAALLLLGNGKFLTPEDAKKLAPLIGNYEISDDSVLLRKIKRFLVPRNYQLMQK